MLDTVSVNVNEKKKTCKTYKCYIYSLFISDHIIASNNEEIKNCTYYHYVDIIKLMILILITLYWMKNLETILSYNVVREALYCAKPLHIFLMKKLDMLEIILTKYLKLCHSYGKCQRIFDRIKYLIMLKSHISDDKKKSQMLQKSKLTQTMIYF